MIIKNDISLLVTIDFHKFGFIEGITFSRFFDENVCHPYDVTIFMRESMSYSARRAKFTCLQIQNIKLNLVDGILKSHTSIEDVTSHQIENANYKVIDDEESIFKFYCSEFTIEIT